MLRSNLDIFDPSDPRAHISTQSHKAHCKATPLASLCSMASPHPSPPKLAPSLYMFDFEG
ncbi:hypothetical protein TorRG33x02_333720 [Trema orientale]|uniref:Uncharacterized protein n=1 Tax=Trema orientale TaxID=63057 RepID=A0A2P5B3U8_TREOI|nr:hypothetical protein TorRG33x02_333720 [Trema orientale]